jgi:hypothetical protein
VLYIYANHILSDLNMDIVEIVAIIIAIVTIPHIAITNHQIAGTSPLAIVVTKVVVTMLSLAQNTEEITQAIHSTMTADGTTTATTTTTTTTTATRTMEAGGTRGDIAPTEIMSEFICTLLV